MLKSKIIKNKSSYERLAVKYKELIGDKEFEKIGYDGYTNTKVIILSESKESDETILVVSDICGEIGCIIDNVMCNANDPTDREVELNYSNDKKLYHLRFKKLDIIGSKNTIENLLNETLCTLTSAEIRNDSLMLPIETGRLSNPKNLTFAVNIISVILYNLLCGIKSKAKINDEKICWDLNFI